ncbi:aspartate--ammonia ligase [Mycoplasmoides fastidiosum]|uniref:Aspartate--ammonia ligase n=1 Tax=Mycoplasmoides fastidiosum TaxID=92758 RepID=A0ABU0LZP7_9BACT|nr:aspartate--ammonia ligase [Mycoplasmoides fastidiosum]MDQ0514158.1 aspartate--ammonia ligase [Mycoplasmoides fastidiosum]UUD37434.1 aspartate--ammonia ligase [Mycoplasmoides fastidiosum]
MYHSKLNITLTQKAIGFLKHHFQIELAKALNLVRVTAPLFLDPETGLNDGLNGEAPVHFSVVTQEQKNKKLEIVHSLAKWKRFALTEYCFQIGEGIYADMNAIRKEEVLSPYHSYYVDQWDWEKAIASFERTEGYLEKVVKTIFEVFKRIETLVNQEFKGLSRKLPDEIFIIDSQVLEDMFPNQTPEQREYSIVKQKKAVFIKRVGHKLKSNVPHSKRAFDYDDWNLNGDFIFYHEPTDAALELSSMGIRVDREALIAQSDKNSEDLRNLSPYHKSVIDETIHFSIGGGIGQSRVCMFFLEKVHIGEVQIGYWTKEMREQAKTKNIYLLQ